MKLSTILFAIVLLFFSCSSSDDMIESDSEDIFMFEGNWLGQWSDSLFPSLSVSAQVQNVGVNKYSGEFFYATNGNGSYTPWCGGVNDGTIRFDTDGDKVLIFEFIQNAPEYMGGCPGIYNGSGVINRNTQQLEIDFAGEDCDGLHENGKIFWRIDR